MRQVRQSIREMIFIDPEQGMVRLAENADAYAIKLRKLGIHGLAYVKARVTDIDDIPAKTYDMIISDHARVLAPNSRATNYYWRYCQNTDREPDLAFGFILGPAAILLPLRKWCGIETDDPISKYNIKPKSMVVYEEKRAFFKDDDDFIKASMLVKLSGG